LTCIVGVVYGRTDHAANARRLLVWRALEQQR
jgi:hypothetical protein